MIDRAVEVLRRGGLVGLPTETVYGLGADATNAAAVARVFAVKGRPATNPLIAHVASVEVARRYVMDWPRSAQRLADQFWPGPLTIVLPRRTQPLPEAGLIVDAVTAGRGTVALRVPAHGLTLEVLRAFDRAVAAPSANRSTRVSPTTAGHVRDELGDAVDLVLDGGACSVGIESTVIDLTPARPRILRPGQVTRAMIEALIGSVDDASDTILPVDTAAVSPGQHERHYAPVTAAFRFEAADRLKLPLESAAVLEITPDAESYARQFYARLRLLDTQQLRAIYIEMPPDTPAWAAVRDRIRRATRPLPTERSVESSDKP